MNRVIKFNGDGVSTNETVPVFIYKKGLPVSIKYLKIGDTITVDDDGYKKFLTKSVSGNVVTYTLKSSFSVEGLVSGTILSNNGLITIGTQQVETATVGTTVITTAGNYDVKITSAAFATGVSPLIISVPVTTADVTAAAVATKVRAALTAHTIVKAVYAISGGGASVILTKIEAVADDATLNVELFANTSTAVGSVNVTPSTTSTTGSATPAVTGLAQTNVAYEVVLDTTQYTITGKTTAGFSVALVAGGTPVTTMKYAVLR